MRRKSLISSIIFTPRCIAPINLFDLRNQKIVLSPWVALTPLALAMMAIVAPTLLPLKIESGEDRALYNP